MRLSLNGPLQSTTDSTQCRAGCGATGALPACWRPRNLGPPLWKTAASKPRDLLPQDPGIVLSGARRSGKLRSTQKLAHGRFLSFARDLPRVERAQCPSVGGS